MTGGGPSVVQRAAAALESSDAGILHYQIEAEQQNGDGTSATRHSETWQLRGGTLLKLTGRSRVSAAYLMGDGAGAVKVIATAEGATRLRQQVARERAQESAGVVLPAEFRSEILALLTSGDAATYDAQVERGADAYITAEARLYPHG